MELYFSNDSKFPFADVHDMDTQPSPSLANMRQPDLKIVIDNSSDDKFDSPSILSSKDPVAEINMYVEKIKNLARKKKVSGNLWEYNTCHSCRGLLDNKLLLHCGEEECSRYFCLRCMNKKYSTSCQDIYNIMKMGKWTCYSCSGICNCKICKDRFIDKANPFFPNQLIKFEKSKRRGPRANNPAKQYEENSTELTNKPEQAQDISSQENSQVLPLELKSNKSSTIVEGETLYKPEEMVEKILQIGKTAKIEKIEKAEKIEKVEKVEIVEKTEKLEKTEQAQKVEKVQKTAKVEKTTKAEKVVKVEKTEKVKKVRKEKSEKSEKGAGPVRPGRPPKADKAEKETKAKKAEGTEKTEKTKKIEKVVEKPEQVQKVEKVENVEKAPQIEKIEKLEEEKPEPKDDLLDLDDMIMITIHNNLSVRSKGIARKKLREIKVMETSSVGEDLVEEKPDKEIEKAPIIAVTEDFPDIQRVGKRGARGSRKKIAEECHLCGKSTPGVSVAVCSVDKCHKTFCELCIHENFQQDFSVKNYNPDCWICYSCGGACKCMKCGRKRVLGFKVDSDDMFQRNIRKSQTKPIDKRRPKFYDPIAEEEYAMPTHLKPSNKAQSKMDVEFIVHGAVEDPEQITEPLEKIVAKKRRLNKPAPVLTKQNIDNSKIISEFDIDSACITLYTAENEDELKMGL